MNNSAVQWRKSQSKGILVIIGGRRHSISQVDYKSIRATVRAQERVTVHGKVTIHEKCHGFMTNVMVHGKGHGPWKGYGS